MQGFRRRRSHWRSCFGELYLERFKVCMCINIFFTNTLRERIGVKFIYVIYIYIYAWGNRESLVIGIVKEEEYERRRVCSEIHAKANDY